MTQNSEASAERARLLGQIAVALDIPVTAFSRVPSGCSDEEPTSAECATMIAAFTRIRDPKMREFCLRMLESFARRG